MVNILDLDDPNKKTTAVRYYCASSSQPTETVSKLSSLGKTVAGLDGLHGSSSRGSVGVIPEKSWPPKCYSLLLRLPNRMTSGVLLLRLY